MTQYFTKDGAFSNLPDRVVLAVDMTHDLGNARLKRQGITKRAAKWYEESEP